jgi:phage/plasmid primase-like uncharacterized protein
MSISDKLIQIMQDAGLKPDCVPVADGKIHRFHDKNDKPGTNNGWYIFFDGDVLGGAFGNWRSGLSETWCEKRSTEMTESERYLFRQQMKVAKDLRDKSLEELRCDCRSKSKFVWEKAPNAPETHPYLQKKGIKPHGARLYQESLVISLYDLGGTLQGLQFIDADGEKRFKKGSLVNSTYYRIDGTETSPIIICEGFATGGSINEATGCTVVCALNCGNLINVARAYRAQFPNTQFIIAGDNDQWTENNPGLSKASEASEAIDAKLVIPVFSDLSSSPVDFNDLHQLEGLEEVKRQILLVPPTQPALMPIVSSSVTSKERKVKESTSDALLKLASQYTFFHDENGIPFVFIDGECIPVKESRTRDTLSYLYYKDTGKAPNSEALSQAINTLAAMARYDGVQVKLNNRIAWLNNTILYDMGDNTAVQINEDGWKSAATPILFRRYGHQQKQVNPVQGGDPWQVFNFLNVGKEHQLIILVSIISCLIPDIPHPILHPHGPQGSGKSSLFKIIKRLIDPSSLEISITPRDDSEFIRTIARHHVALFDNLSELNSRESDIICAACTGGGIAKRMLYTDDDDVIYNIQRCVGINGINLLISKPDLLDRTLLLNLERIDTGKRVTEADLWQKFNSLKPLILGGIFDTLSKAMKIFPSVSIQHLPRLADFARWGYAIAEALSNGDGSKFLISYGENVSRQNQEVVAENSLCRAILTFMECRQLYSGTIGELYKILKEIAAPDSKDATFPKAAKSVRKHLERIRATLVEFNIYVSYGEHTSEGMGITLENRNFASDASQQQQRNDEPELFEDKSIMETKN